MTSLVAVAALAVMVAGRSQAMSASQAVQSTFTGGNPTTVDSAALRTSRPWWVTVIYRWAAATTATATNDAIQSATTVTRARNDINPSHQD